MVIICRYYQSMLLWVSFLTAKVLEKATSFSKLSNFLFILVLKRRRFIYFCTFDYVVPYCWKFEVCICLIWFVTSRSNFHLKNVLDTNIIFSYHKYSIVIAQTVSRYMKQTLKAAGINTSLFTVHSTTLSRSPKIHFIKYPVH